MPTSKRGANRRTMIADAAIELLAREGANGLTHRSVDRALQLPEGSTSYYFRRRQDLLIAAYERVADHFAADLEWVENNDLSPEEAIVTLSRTVSDWLSPKQRNQIVALLELQLESTRQSDVRPIMEKIWERVSARNRALYRSLGVGDGPADMEPFRALLVGLMMRAALHEEFHLPPEEVRSLLEGAAEFLARRAAARTRS